MTLSSASLCKQLRWPPLNTQCHRTSNDSAREMKKHPFIFTTGNVSTRLLSSCPFRPVRSEEQALSLRYAVDWRERQKCISTHSSNVAKGLSILHNSNNCLSNICLEVEDKSILVELRKDPTFCFSLCLTTRAHVAFHLHEMIRNNKHVKLTALKKKSTITVRVHQRVYGVPGWREKTSAHFF